MGHQKPSFWNTLPGVLTGVAAIVTAGTGLYLALHETTNKQTERIESYRSSTPVSPTPNQPISETVISRSNETSATRWQSSSVYTPGSTKARSQKCGEGSLPVVRRIVANELGMNPQDLDVSRPLSQQKSSVSSLNLVGIVMRIEAECSIPRIENLKAEGLSTGSTVEQLARVVDQKLR
jgi:hypothetical protein